MSEGVLRVAAVGVTRSAVVRCSPTSPSRRSPGRMLAVTGSSGSGKTTLLSVLGGLVRPDTGDVRRTTASRSAPGGGEPRRGTAFVLQTYGLVPSLTAEENVAVALRARDVAPAEAVRTGPGGAGAGRRRRPRRAAGHRAAPAVSCNGSRWRGRWPSSPTCCWPTSPRASSTSTTATWWWPRSAPRPTAGCGGRAGHPRPGGRRPVRRRAAPRRRPARPDRRSARCRPSRTVPEHVHDMFRRPG